MAPRATVRGTGGNSAAGTAAAAQPVHSIQGQPRYLYLIISSPLHLSAYSSTSPIFFSLDVHQFQITVNATVSTASSSFFIIVFVIR